MERWVDKVAVVTGASSGIGNAIVKELVKHGMRVAALARRSDRLEELEKEINKKSYIKGIECDITKPAEIKAAVSWIENNWGDINVLVNNAGIARMGSLTSGTGEHLTQVLDTNVAGLVACTREVVSLMKKRQVTQGHVININSIAGHRVPSTPSSYAYVASKHAVTVITKSLKNELASETSTIRVTSISPGLVATEMTKSVSHLNLPQLQPTDISNCVIFALSTPQNVNITEVTVEPTGNVPDRAATKLFKIMKE